MLVVVYWTTQHHITGDGNLGYVRIYVLCCRARFINSTKSACISSVWGVTSMAIVCYMQCILLIHKENYCSKAIWFNWTWACWYINAFLCYSETWFCFFFCEHYLLQYTYIKQEIGERMEKRFEMHCVYIMIVVLISSFSRLLLRLRTYFVSRFLETHFSGCEEWKNIRSYLLKISCELFLYFPTSIKE